MARTGRCELPRQNVYLLRRAVVAVFGKLSEMEHSPPKGPLPAGFVDRFFRRDGSSRASTDKELEAAVERARARLSRLEAQLKERKDKRARELEARRGAELAEKTARAAAAQKAAAEAAAELAALPAEIERACPTSPSVAGPSYFPSFTTVNDGCSRRPSQLWPVITM